jgi:hypothetical protein
MNLLRKYEDAFKLLAAGEGSPKKTRITVEFLYRDVYDNAVERIINDIALASGQPIPAGLQNIGTRTYVEFVMPGGDNILRFELKY